MGAAKWIGGIIGFRAGGPLGALAGFVFGSLFDTDSSDAGSYYGEEPSRTAPSARGAGPQPLVVLESRRPGSVRGDRSRPLEPKRT